MMLDDGALAIYISIGLAGFLVLLWCCAMCVCKGPCRSFDEPVKSPFEMHMDPASKTTALRNKYDVYHYHLMTPKTPTDRHRVIQPTQAVPTSMVPTSVNQTSGSPTAFDFGAVLKMQAAEKANAKRKEHQAKDPLIDKEQGGSSSDTNNDNNFEPKKVNTITVDIESRDDQQAGESLIQDSNV